MSWECFPVWNMVGSGKAPASAEQVPIETAATEAEDKTNAAVVETAREEDITTIEEAADNKEVDIATDEKHIGMSCEDGSPGCASVYKKNGQTQADFAGRGDVEETKDEVVGGPSDQLAGCNVM